MTLSQILDRPGLLFALLAGASAMMLWAAFAFQYFGGLEPCVLCVWQRYPYGAVIILGLLGGGMARGAKPPPGALIAVMGLIALALFTDAAIAGFHVGVEQKWWQGSTACVGATGADSIEALRAQLLALKVVRCDAVAWSLAGVSMAGYNMAAALGLGTVAGLAARRMARHGAGEGGSNG
ncbi:MAG: disulfide bond formation protein B [Alphaproteobacteria bacterium]|nr:disulfide bond formation protein B [Alphaproteobacteria bacterium]